MDEIRIDWSSAEVRNARLELALQPDPPKSWREHFERTLTLLGNEEFGEVGLRKGSLRVGGVQPGSEERLRHFLEGVVDQANSACAAEEQAEQAASADGEGDEEDTRMTEAFRAFGGGGGGGGGGEPTPHRPG